MPLVLNQGSSCSCNKRIRTARTPCPPRRCEKSGNACATVCKRGTVRVERWLKNAIDTQVRIDTGMGSH